MKYFSSEDVKTILTTMKLKKATGPGMEGVNITVEANNKMIDAVIEGIDNINNGGLISNSFSVEIEPKEIKTKAKAQLIWELSILFVGIASGALLTYSLLK